MNYHTTEGLNMLPQAEAAPAKEARVLIVNNLPKTEDYESIIQHIYTLFCHYGNVTLIKIIYQNKQSAFVQFEDEQ
jgi:hypothetical protein